VTLETDGSYTVRVGTAEFGNGTTTVHTQIAAAVLGTEPTGSRCASPTPTWSATTPGRSARRAARLAGRAVHAAATALRESILHAAGITGGFEPGPGSSGRRVCRPARVRPLAGLHVPMGRWWGTVDTTGRPARWRSTCTGSGGVHPGTGELRVLRSVHAADAGTVLNPEQLRGRSRRGGPGAGRGAVRELIVADGRVAHRRAAPVPPAQFADVPRTEVHFADTRRPARPVRAKSMSEAPYNPVAPALANAVRDAIGCDPNELPMSNDRNLAALRPANPSPADRARPTQPGRPEPGWRPTDEQPAAGRHHD